MKSQESKYEFPNTHHDRNGEPGKKKVSAWLNKKLK
jgi:hypothetical protein